VARSRVAVGDRAPDFTLPSQHGEEVRLADLLGSGPVVLYFYPKDETPGCTAEAGSFRERYASFRDMGVEVVGISSDDVASHQHFATHCNLPFLLLSDTGGRVRSAYGVPKTMGLLPGRVTYVIDREGIVRHIFSSQLQATRHVPEALAAVSKLGEEEAGHRA
jgi:peroxiredoxin Q/BCP